MNVNLPSAPESYSQSDESHFRGQLQQLLNAVRSGREDVELTSNQRVIIRSPNGARWALTVSNAGVVGATAL